MIMDRYEEIRRYVDDLIYEIEKMNNYQLRVSCLFSIIDSFVQNYFNYNIKKKNKEIFCEFVLKFADKNKYGFLDKIDPISLIYDNEGQKRRFEELSEANIYTPNSKCLDEISKSYGIKEKSEKLKNRHKYIQLIYACRSKIVHEQQSCGIINVKTENDYNIPIYFDFTSYWKLIFPYTFLKELFLNCIDNYLNYQKENGEDPFNNNIDRKCFYAFYD